MSLMITERAAQEVTRLIDGRRTGEKLYLRVRVDGGGCSGFQHKLDLDGNADPENDEFFEQHGVSVAVDRRSLLYLSGATIDYLDDLNRRGFRIDNPNAKSTCGCGSSFSM